MTTPNIDELITDLQGLANEIEISYRIEVIEEAVKALQSQAERIKELETEVVHKALVIAGWRDKHDTLLAESETQAKAYGIAIVEHHQLRATNERLSLHIKNIGNDALRAENANLSSLLEDYRTKYNDTYVALDDAARENSELRAQLAEIAATEPYAYTHNHEWKLRQSESVIKMVKSFQPEYGFTFPLFTRPMPAQDVPELVEALEKLARLGNGDRYGNSDGNMIARTALSKYKGAK